MTVASLSQRVAGVRPSPTLAITARAKALAKAGHPVISFGAGEPDFNTPKAICEAAIRAIEAGETKYTPSAGLPALREAVAAKLLRENNLRYAPEEVVVSCGAKHSVYNALQVLINPGDEVILIAPYWMTYRDQVVLAGGTPVVIPTTAETGFNPTLEQLREAVSPRTKAIIINSPSNPTGGMLTHATLKNIAAVALRNGMWIISDEIYEHLTYGEAHESIARLSDDVFQQTVTITGCSKSYSMTGWRIGFAAAPKPVAQAMSNLQDQVTSNPTTFAQYGAMAALLLPEEEVETMRQTFERRRDLIVGLLNAIPGVQCALPKGAFYAFPGIESGLSGMDDVSLAQALLDECYVATVPGSVFEGAGHLRLSYATKEEDIEEGIARIAAWMSKRHP